MAHTFIESTMVRQNYQVWSWPRWSRLPLPIYCTQSNLQHCGSRWAFGWYCARSPSTATATSKRRVANVAERRSRRGSQPIIPPPPFRLPTQNPRGIKKRRERWPTILHRPLRIRTCKHFPNAGKPMDPTNVIPWCTATQLFSFASLVQSYTRLTHSELDDNRGVRAFLKVNSTAIGPSNRSSLVTFV